MEEAEAYVETELNKYKDRINMSYQKTQRSDACEA